MNGPVQSRLLLALLVVLVLTPAIASSAAPLTEDEERIFHSGDTDRDPEDVDGSIEDPEVFAQVGDVSYRTTKPGFEVNGTTLLEYQRRSLDQLDTGLRQSRVLPFSDTHSSDLIKDAHVTYLGVHGGAKPRLSASPVGIVPNEYPTFIGEKGKILTHLDYRVDSSVPRSNYCTSPDWETDMVDVPWDDDDKNNTKIYLDGSKTCYEFDLVTNTDREAHFSDDGTFDHDGDVISYDGLDSNDEQTLSVEADITVRVERTETTMDWDPYDIPYPTSPILGNWEDVRSNTDPQYKIDRVSVSNSTQVLVTDAGSLDVSQTVVEVDNDTKHVVLNFDGPRGPNSVNRDQLMNRLLWSYVAIDDQYVAGTWRTYSMQQYQKTFLENSTGRYSESDPPSVPRVFLLGMDRQPTIASDGTGALGTKVIGFEGYNVRTSQSVQSDVSLSPKQPLAYSRIVIENAPSTVSNVTTLHGQEIDVNVENRVEYRKPAITITPLSDSNELRIHVEDPESGDPLTGRRIYLYGAEPKTATGAGYAVTDSNGNVVVTRENPFVRARTARDDWRNPSGSVFYDKAASTATFLPDVLLLQRLYDLVFAITVSSPLILLYFYVRHYGFFE